MKNTPTYRPSAWVTALGLLLGACGPAAPPATFPPTLAPAASESPATNSEAEPIAAATRAISTTEVSLTVADLEESVRFFTAALDAEPLGETLELSGAELEALTGIAGVTTRVRRLLLGSQHIALRQFGPEAGRAAPPDSVSNDLDFQHLAVVVRDMDRAHEHVLAAGATAISIDGPQTIPESNVAAAGIRAYYFHDPERHALELIWFPVGKGDARWQTAEGATVLGIDHTAIAASDTEVSLAFYRDLLGMRVVGESLNEGIEQEHLSAVAGARVRITGLRAAAGMGVELLEYLTPRTGRAARSNASPSDIGYYETSIQVGDLTSSLEVLQAAGTPTISTRPAACDGCRVGARAFVVRDPDGHPVRLVAER